MKILLFNLGTIEHRINSWGIEGFKSLFDQDVILWGPVPDKEFLYNNKEIPILRLFEQTTIKALFDKLPEGWYPDIVACDTSVLNYIPDMYMCPVKTVLFTRDSWSDTIYNRGLVELFDFVVSASIDRSLFYNFHVSVLPLSGFAVSTPGPDSQNSDFEKRKIDVLAIAHYNSSFYHERYKTFYKLSESNKNDIKIDFVKNVKRPEIYNYYQRSKIVVDWAHTLSNRSFEAALNGCLLFSHEDNKVMNEFWVAGDEYVTYNDNNLYERIIYYLSNPEEAKSIIRNAQQKIKTRPSSWGDMVWEKINIAYKASVSVEERIKHNQSLPLSTLHYRSATPLLYNYDYNKNFPSNWQDLYFDRIDNAISSSTDQVATITPLIEAARVAFLLNRTELAIIYLQKLQDVLPDYAWIGYLFGRIFFEQGEYDRALLFLQEGIDNGFKAPELLKKYVLPVREKGNPCDGRRITDYMWQSVYAHDNDFQVKSFFHLSYELAGDIYRLRGKQDEAIDAYFEAINYLKIPHCIYKLNQLLIQSKKYEKLLEIAQGGIEDSPYDSIIVLSSAYALLRSGNRLSAFKSLRAHQKALKSFIGNRQVRISLYIILPLVLIGKQPASGIILELIKTLNNKSIVN